MEQYKTNQILSINDKFFLIENHFMILSSSLKKKLLKINSHLNLLNRPLLKKKNKLLIDNKTIETRNPLDQIGNDDLIFNNDKLITSIKLDSLNEFYQNDKIEENDKNDNIRNKRIKNRKSLTPVRESRKKINIPPINIKNNINNDSLEIFSNKNTYNNKGKEKEKEKIINNRNLKNNRNLIPYNRLKNINQFINKPNDNNINLKKICMSPINNKTMSNMTYKNSFSRVNNIKISSTHDKNNDSISLNSGSRMGFKHSKRGKSMPNFHKNKFNMHFPNKSTIKNKDKLYNELQKIFGEKITLNEDIYNNMTDFDKKNCINFLLETVKELFNINKNIQSRNENYKEINETKERQLKDNKKEIKDLKKDISKLNKIIKTNIQMNRKLCQNIDNLKLQLEKAKNKNKELHLRSKSSAKNIHNYNNKNDINEFSLTTIKRNRFRSQDKYRDAKVFINLKKRINSSKEKNENNNKKNVININNIKIEESKNNSNENNSFDNNLNNELTSEVNINNNKNNNENDIITDNNVISK